MPFSSINTQNRMNRFVEPNPNNHLYVVCNEAMANAQTKFLLNFICQSRIESIARNRKKKRKTKTLFSLVAIEFLFRCCWAPKSRGHSFGSFDETWNAITDDAGIVLKWRRTFFVCFRHFGLNEKTSQKKLQNKKKKRIVLMTIANRFVRMLLCLVHLHRQNFCRAMNYRSNEWDERSESFFSYQQELTHSLMELWYIHHLQYLHWLTYLYAMNFSKSVWKRNSNNQTKYKHLVTHPTTEPHKSTVPGHKWCIFNNIFIFTTCVLQCLFSIWHITPLLWLNVMYAMNTSKSQLDFVGSINAKCLYGLRPVDYLVCALDETNVFVSVLKSHHSARNLYFWLNVKTH